MTYDPFDPFNQLLTETPPEVLAAGQEWVEQQFYGDAMYQDFYLRFADQAEADSTLFEVQADAEGGEVKVPKYAAVDVIGVIYKATGKTLKTPEGPVPEMKPIPGWHVNVRHTEAAPELDAYKVEVATPARMWA